MKTCAHCAFAERRSAHYVECRIRAPGAGVDHWPKRAPGEWCGEFKPLIPSAPRDAPLPAFSTSSVPVCLGRAAPEVQWPRPSFHPPYAA